MLKLREGGLRHTGAEPPRPPVPVPVGVSIHPGSLIWLGASQCVEGGDGSTPCGTEREQEVVAGGVGDL